MAEKELLFSLTKKDFQVEHIRGSGPGGQHRNKVATGVRIRHKESGATGVATDSKSQTTNKKSAFLRLIESEKFKKWHRWEIAKRTGDAAILEAEVDSSLKRIKVEVKDENGKWIKTDKLS